MSEMTKPRERRRNPDVAATVNEAAFVAGVSRHTVNQAIDRGEIKTRRGRRKTDPPGRVLGGAELVYLRVQKPLSPQTRKEVYRRLSAFDVGSVPQVIEVEGAIKLDIGEPVAQVRARLLALDRIRLRVQVDPEIRGGEPVFRGTRIPVQMIANFLERGVPRAEILEDYPALDEELLEIARDYAALYPRRGRPRQAPWRAGPPTHTFGPDEPGD